MNFVSLEKWEPYTFLWHNSHQATRETQSQTLYVKGPQDRWGG